MNIPRFMKEYANYIAREYLNEHNDDVDNLLTAWKRGHKTTAEVMSTLTNIELANMKGASKK